MKDWTIGVIVILIAVLAFGAWWIWGESISEQLSITDIADQTTETETTASSRTLISTAMYRCDNDRTISAMYYAGPEMPTPAPGEPPQPTGSVEVSLNGGASSTLAQTISADGARYATADESFVFWSKGDQALILRNNTMDLDYTNCVAQE